MCPHICSNQAILEGPLSAGSQPQNFKICLRNCLNFAPLSLPCPSPQIPCSVADPPHRYSQWRGRSPSLESCPTSRDIYLWCFFKKPEIFHKSRDSAPTVFNGKIIKIYEYCCSKRAVRLSVRDDKVLRVGHLAGHPQWTPGSWFSLALAGAAAPLRVDVSVTTVTSEGEKAL